MNTKIIYEDEALLVVHKPAGIATQSAQVGRLDVVSELKSYLKRTTGDSYLGVIHRLDQPVEGLLVFAKTKQAAAVLTKQLTEQGLNKSYYAVCDQSQSRSQNKSSDAAYNQGGFPSEDEMIEKDLKDYLIKTKDNLALVVTKDTTGAKCALLHYKKIDSVDISDLPKVSGENTGLPIRLLAMDIHIETGRFHQIRCQMAHEKLPLLGDSKYGTKETMGHSKALGVDMVALCAYKLEFLHPQTKKKMEYIVKPANQAFSFFSNELF